VAHDSWRSSLLGARDCIARRIGGASLDSLISNSQALNGKVVSQPLDASRLRRLQALGVLCGFSAGAWLGAAEAPTKFVNAGVSPIVVSLLMVIGVFLARWSLPALIRGTGQIRLDVREAPHLIVWGVLAGCLWAVANSMTIFAIRDIGLSIAFPLWNINSLLGIFWGFFLFNELRDAGRLRWLSVIGGAVLMFAGAALLTLASSSQMAAQHATRGILAALCAGILWGTMYIPYRKAYLTGMNPLSFVAFFTIGELGMMSVLALSYSGGPSALWSELLSARPALFWLMLGGFVWVIGDLFQQYAAKYVGISRGIPLSNSNQLWGLLWGIFVFGELQGRGSSVYAEVIGGSLLMAAGAGAIALSTAGGKEHARWDEAAQREGQRYGVDANYVQAGLEGKSRNDVESEHGRNWVDWVLVVLATAVFVTLAAMARATQMTLNGNAVAALCIVMFIFLAGCGIALWKITRFN
jgi:drug/metabolite transporter (DMT)-like permease